LSSLLGSFFVVVVERLEVQTRQTCPWVSNVIR
jgi:hypothetical protein